VPTTYLKAEVVYSAREEGAMHLEDVLVRRTHINIEVQDRGVEAAPVVADLMAKELGWSDEQRQTELDAYLQRVEAELKANAAPTDEEAQQARLEAPGRGRARLTQRVGHTAPGWTHTPGPSSSSIRIQS
jgi:glycerol-3-phosphate dehydrogenase